VHDPHFALFRHSVTCSGDRDPRPAFVLLINDTRTAGHTIVCRPVNCAQAAAAAAWLQRAAERGFALAQTRLAVLHLAGRGVERDPAEARRWGADGSYGAHGDATLATAHSLRELRRFTRAEAVLLSPVFPTRSHPGGQVLGPLRFRLLAARAPAPVIALGGMNPSAANRLKWPRWAGIDAFLR
jgi:thiamine monophosphate synthase